jgi:hypothetical protein
MSNMTPFEIRLELLKMAKDMLSDDYYGKRESISNQYASQCEYAKLNGQPVPDHPGFPPFPNESEIVTKANALNGFVSNIPLPLESPKVTIKKTS